MAACKIISQVLPLPTASCTGSQFDLVVAQSRGLVTSRRSRSRIVLFAVGIVAVFVGVSKFTKSGRTITDSDLTPQQWPIISAAALVAGFEDNPAYMHSAGWQRGEGGGYLPTAMRSVQFTGQPGYAHVTSWYSDSSTGCGPAQVRIVLHMDAVIEGVDPIFAEEVFLSPHYGLEWNPGIKDVLLRKFRVGGYEQDIPQTFYPGDGEIPPEPHMGESSAFALIGQVTEIPLPGFVAASFGRRFTADWVAHRFECGSKRGYTVGTSTNVTDLGREAGVEIGQDLCHTAVLVAPWTGAAGQNGSVVHMISHVDPHVPAPFMSFTVKATRATLTSMMQGVGRKAWEIQQKGQHPEVHC